MKDAVKSLVSALSKKEPILICLGRVLLFIHLLLSPLIFQRGLIEVFEYPKAALLTTTALLLLAGFISHSAWQRTYRKTEKREKKKKEKDTRRRRAEKNGLDKLTPLGMLLFLASAFFFNPLLTKWDNVTLWRA